MQQIHGSGKSKDEEKGKVEEGKENVAEYENNDEETETERLTTKSAKHLPEFRVYTGKREQSKQSYITQS